MAQKEVREIVIRVDTPGGAGLRKISDEFGKLNRNISEGTSILKRFEQAYFRIAGLSFAGIGLNAIIQSLDTFQKLNDKLRQTEGSSEGARVALFKLASAAEMTRSSITDTSAIYTRMRQSMSDLNLSSDAVLGVTVALQNAFRAYGATAAEAQSSTVQLGQAFSSGRLQGQELRSVIESSGLIAEVLSKKLNIARGELLKFAEKNGGVDVGAVIGALADGFDRINTAASELTPTVGETLTMALDKVKIKMGLLNEEVGATKKLSAGIMFVAENIDTIAKALGVSIGVWTLYKAAVLSVAVVTKGMTAATLLQTLAIGIGGYGIKAYTLGLYQMATASALAQAAMGPLGLALLGISAITAALVVNNSDLEEKEKMKNVWLVQASGHYDKQGRLLKQNAEGVYEVANANKNLNYEIPKVVANLAEMSGWTQKGATGINGVLKTALQNAASTLESTRKSTFNYTAALKDLNKQFDPDSSNLAEYKKALLQLDLKKIRQEYDSGTLSAEKYRKEKAELLNGKPLSALKEFRGELSELNKQFESRTGDASGYAKALAEIKIGKSKNDLEEGRLSLLDFNKQTRDTSLGNYNRQLAEGAISLSSYREESQKLQLAQLNEEWRAGTLDIYAYNKAIVETQDKFSPSSAFFTGTNAYIAQAGTLSSNVANMVTTTFGNLENTMVDFVKTGKFAFKDFAMSVLEDLNRIIIRSMIIRPLAQGILGAIPGSTDAAGGTTSASGDYVGGKTGGYAKGGAFNRGVEFFAKGGVVSSTTAFGMRGGMGVMGEKGPEAIMPLKRTPSGDLGVQAAPSNTNISINVMNTSDAQVETKTTTNSDGTKQIDFYIKKKLVESLTDGSLDKTMSQNYNLRRKGV